MYPPGVGATEHAFHYNIPIYSLVPNLLLVYMYCNGWLKCQLQSGTYNNNRLLLGYFSLIVIDLKYA